MPGDTTTTDTTATTGAAALAASAASGTVPAASGAGGTNAGETGTSAATGGTGAAAGETNVGAGGTAPVTYELKLSDGSTADAGLVERTTATAREWGLGNEVAQKLLDREVARSAEVATATTAAVDAAKAEQLAAMQAGGTVWNETQTKWKDTALADAEIGGSPEKLQANVDMALKVMNKFATDSTKKFLNDSGLGSHPELVRVFARIGKQMSEATLALPSSSTGGAKTEDEILAKRYPTMAPKS